jgi:hypothetical protein
MATSVIPREDLSVSDINHARHFDLGVYPSDQRGVGSRVICIKTVSLPDDKISILINNVSILTIRNFISDINFITFYKVFSLVSGWILIIAGFFIVNATRLAKISSSVLRCPST